MRRIRKRLIRHSYVFTLESGETMSGVLEDSDSDFYVLQQVRTLGPDGQWLPIDGRLIIPASRVAYIQAEA